METPYHTIQVPWSEFPEFCFWYIFPFMAVLHLFMFILGSAILPILPRKKPESLGRHIGRFGLFMLLLLFVGAFFNGFWCCSIAGRLYYQTDYEFDFSPFWPIGADEIQRAKEVQFG